MKIKGIKISDKIGIGKVYIKKELPEIKKEKIDDTQKEIKRVEEVIKEITKELKELFELKKESLGEEKAQIFKAHEMILNDPELKKEIKEYIEKQNVNAEFGTKKVIDDFVKRFEAMDNEYFRQRASDIKDIGKRIISKLLGINQKDLSSLKKGTVVVAKDLTPSDTAMLKKENIEGIITEIGGKTSHSAIIANTLGIPALMGVKGIIEAIKVNDKVIIDGKASEIYINPDKEILEKYKEKKEKQIKEQSLLKKYKDKSTKTLDGKEIELSCNAASIKDIEIANKEGSEGIGLFRSEFIYMESNKLPTRKEQVKIYKEVLKEMGQKPLIIRTMDIGGDKEVDYLEFEKELNPFLGYRAIRYCLDEKEVFKTQIKALLQASTVGNLKIMIPMISSLGELREAKKLIEESKEELRKEKVEFKKDIPLGMMIEVPSAALMSDKLAKEVDFFSIGTNDLVQYTTATDRMNPKVSKLYSPYNPGVLRLIDMTIRNGHKENIWVGMCGSVAGDQRLIPLLLAMGLDEFSVSPSKLLKSRKLINSLDTKKLQEMKEKVLDQGTKEEVKSVLEEYKYKK